MKILPELTSFSLLTSILLILPILAFPQGMLYDWANGVGGPGSEGPTNMTVDGAGNVFVTGGFRDTVDFDPGVGIVNLISFASSDIFFAKYDSNGNLIWANSIGGVGGVGSQSEAGQDIWLDLAGNVYLCGDYSGTADFDPGIGTANLLATSNTKDAFIAKYDGNGNYLWAISIGGTLSENVKGVRPNLLGEVYVTGTFVGTMDFDPGVGVATLISVGAGRDIFIAKYDASGNYIWAKGIGGTSDNVVTNISVDVTGNIYISGHYSLTVDFDPSGGTANRTSAGWLDSFLAKYDSSGNFVWANSVGGAAGHDRTYGLASDNQSNVYITGHFQDTVDFDPGVDTANVPLIGASDLYIAKYDSNGNYIWAKGIGATASETGGEDIIVDGAGNVYVTGYFDDATTDFDPGPGIANLYNSGFADVFFVKLDSNGNYIWVRGIGGSFSDRGYCIGFDSSDNVYVSGTFYDTTDFDAGVDTAYLTSAGFSDMFITKYSPCTYINITVQPSGSVKCVGESVSFNVSASGTGPLNYQWQYNGVDIPGATDSLYSIGSVIIGSAGNYVCVVSSACNVDSSDVAILVVNLLPTITASGTATICTGASTTLTATGASTYSWDNGAGTGSSVSVSPTTTTTYTVTGTDGNGCQNTDQVTITVNALPTVTASGTATICSGASTTLTATGTSTYSWDNGGGAGASVSVSPTTTTTYTVTGTDGNGCQNTDQVTVTVNALPTVIATGTTSICTGASATLTVTGATTYSWDNGAGTGSSVSVSPTATTTYTVTGTDGNGCQNTDQITVTVNALPTVTASGTATICSGTSTALTATGASTYSWDNGAGTGSSVNVSPTATTTYTVTGADGNGCTNTDQVTVTVNSLPTVTASGTATICTGASTTLTASGASTYSWDNGGGSGSSVSVSPTATTTYTVTGTDGNGCTATDNVTVTVNSTTADAGTDVDICIGLNTTLSASGGTSYSWSPTTGLSDPNIANPVASPTVTTSYIVTVTDANTCTDDDTVVVTVNPLPTADAGADVAICSGSSTTLSASGGVTYSWNPATDLSDANIANPVASPTATTTYIVTVDNGGCTDEDTVIVTVNSLPTVTASGTTAICDGESATLTVTGATTYNWDNGAGTGSSVTVSPTVTTTYTVTGADGNNCTGSDAVVVTVNANPATPVINPSGNTLACSVTGSSYQWYFNSDTIVGATNQVHVATQSGFYSVTIIDNNGCSATSDLLDVTVVGIKKVIAGVSIDVYPNPNRGEFTVEIQVSQVQDIELKIVNLLGQVVFEDVLKQCTGSCSKVIDLKGFAKGVYELQIQTKTGKVNKSIILE